MAPLDSSRGLPAYLEYHSWSTSRVVPGRKVVNSRPVFTWRRIWLMSHVASSSGLLYADTSIRHNHQPFPTPPPSSFIPTHSSTTFPILSPCPETCPWGSASAHQEKKRRRKRGRGEDRLYAPPSLTMHSAWSLNGSRPALLYSMPLMPFQNIRMCPRGH